MNERDGFDGDNSRHRRLSAAVADPTGRRNPTKSIFAGMTHTHQIPPAFYRIHLYEVLYNLLYTNRGHIRLSIVLLCRWISWWFGDHDNISY